MNASMDTMKMTATAVSMGLALLLAGCTGAPVKVDERPITATLEGAGVPFARDRVAPLDAPEPLPAGELSTADAVAWSLANHPRVHEVLAGLDAQAAQRWQAGLLPNPMLSVMGMRRDGGGWMLEYGLMQSLIAVLERPRRVADADAALGQATVEAAVELLALAREVEAAHLAATAAAQRERILARRLALVDDRLDLLRRQQARGNATQLTLLAVEQEAAQARAGLADAASEAAQRRGSLAIAMGLDRGAAPGLPDALPRPPDADIDEALLQGIARRQRPDLELAAASRGRAATTLELDRFARGTDVLDVGVRREPDAVGPELRVSIPLFDNAAARVARGRADADAALAREVLLQRQAAVEVERAVQVVATRQRAHDQAGTAATLAAERASLAQRLQAGGAADLDQALAARETGVQAELAQLDARLALWQAWLDLAAVTASALAAPATED